MLSMYEVIKADVERVVRALSVTVEPILIRDKRQVTHRETIIALRGRPHPGLT